ncbi:MAG: polysaccharide deacetylase family protein [Candidatus Aminicenantes bacterium]|nr:MAG: polysaccharide deacetylase family protein [Candidatus Aminicenantes bacterium]
MKSLLLTFDIEEYDAPRDLYKYNDLKLTKNEMFEFGRRGTEKIFQFLDQKEITATLFVTATFAERYPKLIQETSKRYEIGLHGYSHGHDYWKMPLDKASDYIEGGKKILESIIKKKVIGFRAPRMHPIPHKKLYELCFKYDSSYHPTYVPQRYNNFFKERKIHKRNGITVVPASVTPLIRLPFSYLWFRNFGINYARLCTLITSLADNYICLYFHSYDFEDINKISPYLPIYFIKNTGE